MPPQKRCGVYGVFSQSYAGKCLAGKVGNNLVGQVLTSSHQNLWQMNGLLIYVALND
jgi:hypothetical protein